MKQRKIRTLSNEDLERLAIETIDVIVEKLEKENLDLASTVIVIEKDSDNVITTRVEVEVYSDTPLIPSAEEKVAEVIDAARRKLENELFDKDKIS